MNDLGKRGYWTALAAWCVMALLTIGCSGSRPKISDSAVTGGGSTFAAPIINTWAEQYHKRHADVDIHYESIGSGEGEKRFIEGSIDFGGTDAGLSEATLSSVEGGAIQIPITAGIIVLAYNPEGLPAKLNLPRNVYVDAFLGKETRWNDPRIQEANPGKKLPDQPIHVIVRQDSSGTTFAFTNHLAAINDEWADQFGSNPSDASRGRGVKVLDWPGAAMSASGNSGVAGRIKQTPYSISYVQYGAAREVGLGMAALENRAGNYVAPSGTSGLETLLNAELPDNLLAYVPDPRGEYSYPIVTFTWILLRKQYADEAQTERVKSFIQWCLTSGQDYAEAAGNVRLAPHVIRASESKLESMKVVSKDSFVQTP
ncbi:phosphate ABC transporter substrate-binding protein PstS [Novipirellula sp.]|uniref:phosphate ABC transporter substrate-binding protein PstS n=1 Tax=Novipirellula sp. TaxID=2795430 RepID=UPI003564AC62